jgi:hypothetical protein
MISRDFGEMFSRHWIEAWNRIYYRGVRGPAAEVFFFNGEGLVIRAAAHYE